LSPDGRWKVSVKNYNLYLKSTADSNEIQLTSDGIEKYEYATPVSWYKIVDESVGDSYDPEIEINWSPDSKKFTTYKLDRRKEGRLYLYQALPDSGYKAKIWSYERTLPGEETATTKEHFIFNVEKNSMVKMDIQPYADFLSWEAPKWVNNGQKLFFRKFTRGYKAYDLYSVDIQTGKVKQLIHDSSKTMIEYQMVEAEYIDHGEKVIWRSERDGWAHLYLHDANTGILINQITKGEYVVRYIAAVDDDTKTIWFVAGGKETGRDPYYQHLYKINFDGSNLQLLTPENAEHEISVSPDKQYFVDNLSRADLKPKAVLRRLDDGKLIANLQEADISKLIATGWKYPKPFSVKGRDGKTDIYGLLFYPSNFDENKKYPVIDGTYSGPQAVRTAKSFSRALKNADVPLAELGFIVMTIDGFGTAWRSKAFHDYSYENLGDIGAIDHIGGLKQLAEKNPYLDTTRVGIYGHSAGGYDAAHALLIHPEFYKVGVSSSGNHDIRMSKAWWPEQYMGMPGTHYSEQSNLTLAKNLQGHLLLATGDMDNNVNPANTLRLAAELVKANKDFELVIIPNKDHGGVYYHPYFMRKRWDFFVKYLMGVEPPKYEIKQQ
ncbi:MAG: prolyl oligopeptidase family serine peptidase, partial [Bacteroidales bacterium]|nr:prolyl oligopeptidase family serine peptidase [Bacteroidales bacterium]